MNAYTIRPLEWKKSTPSSNTRATTTFGDYEIWPYNDGDARHFWASPDALVGTRVASIEDAKAAAEAHYLSRLLPALSPIPSAAKEQK